jgi:hypothetical protein
LHLNNFSNVYENSLNHLQAARIPVFNSHAPATCSDLLSAAPSNYFQQECVT